MRLWITPITNRTQNDINRVIYLNQKVQSNTATEDELTEWKNDLPGAFNLSDQERIINNMNIINDVLETNLTIPESTNFITKTWWTQILNCVQVERDAYLTYETTPPTPSTLNKFKDINDVEKILEDVYSILNAQFFKYCGESYYCGEKFGLLL